MKIISFILLLAMMLTSFVACGGNTTDTDSGNENGGNNSAENAGQYAIERIEAFRNGYARFSVSVKDENGYPATKYGYLNSKGEVVIAPEYDEAPEVADDLMYVTKDSESFFVNMKNEKITYEAPIGTVEKIGEYSNGYFWIQTYESKISGDVHSMTYYDVNGKKAFIIENAEESEYMISGSELHNAGKKRSNSSFNENGLALVTINARNELINTEGNIVAHGNYQIEELHGNYFTTWDHVYYINPENMGFITTNMEPDLFKKLKFLENDYVVSYGIGSNEADQYQRVESYYEIICVKEMLNLTEISVLSGANIRGVSYSSYNGIKYFVLYLESKDGKFFSAVINAQGGMVIEPTQKFALGKIMHSQTNIVADNIVYEVFTVSDGLIVAQDTSTGLFGYINLSGEWAIQPQYDSATTFSNGVAVVNNNTIINTSGEVILAAK